MASSAPSRSVIAPRAAGTVTLLTCWVAAARASDPDRTDPRYTARASAMPSSATNAMNRTPMRRSMSAKRYPPPLAWVESVGWIAAAPVGGACEDCVGVLVAGAWEVVVGGDVAVCCGAVVAVLVAGVLVAG